jgi:hypothetical protein
MEVIPSPETSVLTRPTRRLIPEDSILVFSLLLYIIIVIIAVAKYLNKLIETDRNYC